MNSTYSKQYYQDNKSRIYANHKKRLECPINGPMRIEKIRLLASAYYEKNKEAMKAYEREKYNSISDEKKLKRKQQMRENYYKRKALKKAQQSL